MARRSGEASYSEFSFQAHADHFFTADLPPDMVSPPGLEYYLVAKDAKGGRKLVYGTPEEPLSVPVEAGINAGPALERYHYGHTLRAKAERRYYPDAGKGEAQLYRYETEYTHRRVGPFQAIRFGQGLLRTHYSSPGPLLPQQGEPGFFYSYLEAELANPAGSDSMVLRAMGGAVEGRTGSGFEVRFRFGDEQGMNVTTGLSKIETLGATAMLALHLRLQSWLTLSLGGDVSNMPDINTMGYAEYADLGISSSRQLSLELRIGAASRAASAVGGIFGAGLSYEF
jgi:hypothetical protein